MPRSPLPRFRVDLHVTVELGAADVDAAEARADAAAELALARLRRSAFERLPGAPRAVRVELGEVSKC